MDQKYIGIFNTPSFKEMQELYEVVESGICPD